MEQYLLQNYWSDKANGTLLFKSFKAFNTFEWSIRDLRLLAVDGKLLCLLCYAFLVSQMRVTLRLNSRGARALRAGPRVCPNTLCWRRLPISCVHQIICLRIARPRMAPTVEGKA